MAPKAVVKRFETELKLVARMPRELGGLILGMADGEEMIPGGDAHCTVCTAHSWMSKPANCYIPL